jgi:transglutaminase/protease-like cytokinesis protein 3
MIFFAASKETFCQIKTEDEIIAIIDGYPKFKQVNEISNQIKNDFISDVERAQAIYIWMAFNIEYDIFFLKSFKRNKARKNAHHIIKNRYRNSDLTSKEIKLESKFIRKTIRKNRTSYLGNSLLFDKLCQLCDIESKIINGMAKIPKPNSFQSKIYTKYTMNAIHIDSQWYLVDVTYGSMAYGFSKNSHPRKYSNVYFMARPDVLQFSHYTMDTIWTPYQNENKEIFKRSLTPYTPLYENKIKVISPIFKDINISSPNLMITLKNVKEDQLFSYSLSYTKNNKTRVNPISINNNTSILIIHNFNLEDGYLTIYLNEKPILNYYLNHITNPNQLGTRE